MACNTASNIRDTTFHCLSPMVTEYTPDLNLVDYKAWDITRSISTPCSSQVSLQISDVEYGTRRR